MPNYSGIRNDDWREEARRLNLTIPEGVSRQRIWQIIRIAKGLCEYCGCKVKTGYKKCQTHLDMARDQYDRKRQSGERKRYRPRMKAIPLEVITHALRDKSAMSQEAFEREHPCFAGWSDSQLDRELLLRLAEFVLTSEVTH